MYKSSKLQIAVTGKGGVGKTVLSAIMGRLFVNIGKKVLLVDADPTIGLAYALGQEATKTIGDYRDKLVRKPGLRRELEDMSMKDVLIQEALVEVNGFSLLVMGKEESTGCYCPVNHLLRYGIGSIAKNYDIMIVDCEAGLEQIHRRVINSINILFIVTDLSIRGIKATIKIKEIIENGKAIKKCDRLGVIINRVKAEDDAFREIMEKEKLEIFGSVPEDGNVSRLDFEGRAISELSDTSPSVIAVNGILKSLKI